MHSYICYQFSTRPRTVWIFILRLSERPFSGLVGEAASPSIILHPPSGAAGIYPLLGFLLYELCSPTPWIFGNVTRSLLHNWGFHFNWLLFSQHFLRRLRRCWRTCLHFLRELALQFYPDPFDVIVSGCLIFQHLQPQCICGYLVSFFPCTKGIQSSQRDCFAIARDVWGSLLPAFYSCCPLTKKVFRGCLPFSITSFTLYQYFLLLYRGKLN